MPGLRRNAVRCCSQCIITPYLRPEVLEVFARAYIDDIVELLRQNRHGLYERELIIEGLTLSARFAKHGHYYCHKAHFLRLYELVEKPTFMWNECYEDSWQRLCANLLSFTSLIE